LLSSVTVTINGDCLIITVVHKW